ncbi:membrane-bound lytic murein transglycosylase D [Pontibacter aydingkolensis]|uniref:LysM peptidoglycan-binding domain-containing protein n=1 Tax=Pontibacter aydingkolensis TaxID=1911536 RepID=A0ABS7CS73_9BACT|nr:lytic transglycosylase domain-containing protein [Pontibacter aydingkolensis]MBW7466635.1 LysM peptidoglycan-binding domain-containing protein [Pontibacter aydingkolensis]
MTYFRLFTVIATVIGSLCATGTQAANYSFIQQHPAPTDTIKPEQNIRTISDEELALLVEHIPNEPNDVIQDRLSCIESEIPLEFNSTVRAHIDYFTIRNRKYTRTMLSRENVYFPLFEKYLEKHNMPQDLKYLAIVESGLNPKAASWAKAVGLWQFIPVTGKEYGLEQNQYIDERMDPEKSTDAAMRFLKRLYKTYGDWELAMAAYNCGPGNVNKAIRKAGGGKKTFWQIYPYLPRETRNYIPSMTAVIYSMNYAADHNIFSDSILYTPEVVYLELNKEVDLEKLAEELHLSPQQLMALNPEIKQTRIPEHLLNYRIRIPAQTANMVANVTDKECILLAAAPVKLPEPEITPEPTKATVLLASAKSDTTVKPEQEESVSSEKVIYTVRRGDNLSSIAQSHNIALEDLKEWNNLKGSSIMAGQKLSIIKPAQKTDTELIAVNNEASEPAKANIAKPAPEKKKKQDLIYHVQPGDTLWTISQKHNGLTVEQIKKINKLKSNAIQPGQKLILG